MYCCYFYINISATCLSRWHVVFLSHLLVDFLLHFMKASTSLRFNMQMKSTSTSCSTIILVTTMNGTRKTSFLFCSQLWHFSKGRLPNIKTGKQIVYIIWSHIFCKSVVLKSKHLKKQSCINLLFLQACYVWCKTVERYTETNRICRSKQRIRVWISTHFQHLRISGNTCLFKQTLETRIYKELGLNTYTCTFHCYNTVPLDIHRWMFDTSRDLEFQCPLVQDSFLKI